MQKKWKESVKNRLQAGGGIEKKMRNERLLEGEENLRMMNSYVRGTVRR